MNPKDELITNVIKGRKIIYHLVTEDDLNNLIEKDIFQSVFLIIFSVALGAFISKDNYVYLWISLISLILTLLFWCRKFIFMRKIKKSAEFDIYKNATDKVNICSDKIFNITQVIYGSSTKFADITEEIKKLVKEDRFIYKGEYNYITGKFIDPHVGIKKQLKIKYIYNGINFSKEFTENDPVDLPL